MWLENASRDVRFAARGLARKAGFSLVAVLTLAIGVGATTAVFSLANSLLIRPVPGVHAPQDLVVVQFSPAPGLITGISHANIVDLRAARQHYLVWLVTRDARCRRARRRARHSRSMLRSYRASY